MVNYQLGKIYKIVCNTTGLIYIGSTCEPTLAKRLAKHNGNYIEYINKKRNFITSFKILENKNFEIILLDEYPCDSKDQLHKRERFFIDSNDCVNKVIPTRSKSEYDKLYHEVNKVKRQTQTKLYREKNKEHKKEQDKLYYEKNKDKIKERIKLKKEKKLLENI